MRIEQLEYVAAVTEHGSLRRAAERLHVSQPALSEAISKLERELGATLLDRHRSGARISATGRDLLQPMVDVLEAVTRLRSAAGDRLTVGRTIRIGTVNAGTAALLLPAIAKFQKAVPGASVEVRNLQQDEIRTGLADGTLELGLVNLLDGDDVPPDLIGIELQRGRPVAVLPADHPLTVQTEVSADDLRGERFIGMRAGYVMHRFAHRLFGAELPASWHSTDGAEMGKLMVAEGLGITLLPDYSVTGDPFERTGSILTRPLAGDRTTIRLTLQQRRAQKPTPAAQAMVDALLRTSELRAKVRSADQ